MKTLKFYAALAAIAFTTVSCVENSDKYKAVVAERDSVIRVNQGLGDNYNQTLELLNDIESGFSAIAEGESEMKLDMKGIEGSSSSQKDRIGAKMNSIKEIIERNKAKIAELQRLVGKNGKENAMLAETIKRLQGELDEKTALISSLQDELKQKNIKIDELNTTVDKLNTNVAELNNVSEQQKATIKTQDTNMNIVWYCVATTKKLKESQIITGTGLFQKKQVMGKEFDQRAFTQADLRTVKSIPTNSKKVVILSSHPQDSYTLVTGADKIITIEISNPAKFWSISKYLVVQI